MGDATARLLELRPVMFRYKQPQTVPSGEVPPEYGLIAEEVAEILPDLVVYDKQGKPFTVKYHMLSSMLLNEVEKLDQRCKAQSEELLAVKEQQLEQHCHDLAHMHDIEARLASLESTAASIAALPVRER